MKNTKSPQLVIGFIVYGKLTAGYLPYFLASLKQQTFSDFSILVLDHSPDKNNDNQKILEDYPGLDYKWLGKNLGFAAGHNILIKQAKALGAKYYLAINPDLILESKAIANLIKALQFNEKLGSVAPKVLRWDFVNKTKTEVIDSCGLVEIGALRCVDLGQGQIDKGQYDQAQILGPSGCLAMYRLSALEAVSDNGQYYDELFFMYKEDIDLAYRLRLAGWDTQLVPKAVAYHDRTVFSQGTSSIKIALNRKNKSKQNKRWSFWGQQVLFYKFWLWQGFWGRLSIIWYQFKSLIFIIFFEQYLFTEVVKFEKIKRQVSAKNRGLKVK